MAVRARHRVALAAAALAALGAATVSLATPPTGGRVTYRVTSLPAAPGLGLTHNDDVEPGMAVDGGGTIWVAASIAPNAGGTDTRDAEGFTGGDVWKSTDDGRSFAWVDDPFAAAAGRPGPGGQDTDVAAAPARNANGSYNVYVVSGWIGSTAAAISTDGGSTWSLNPLGGIVLSDDRPFVTATGPCTFFVTYHVSLVTETETVVNSYDACDTTKVGTGLPLNPVTSTNTTLASMVSGSNRLGKPVADGAGNLYVPMLDCKVDPASAVPSLIASTCPDGAEFVVAVSRDGGATFTDFEMPGPGISNGHVFYGEVSAAVDAAGTLYVAYSNDEHVYLAVARGLAKSDSPIWSVPAESQPLDDRAGSAVFPTPVAGEPGHVAVAWYATNRRGQANDGAVMGVPGAHTSAPWHLVVAESSDSGRSWSQTALALVNHYGVLCTEGTLCDTSTPSRTMYENFGIGLTTSHHPLVAFMDDQPCGCKADDQIVAATPYVTARRGR